MQRKEQIMLSFVPECMYAEFCDRFGIDQTRYPYVRLVRQDLSKPLAQCAVFDYGIKKLGDIPVMQAEIVYKEIAGRKEFRFTVHLV